MVHELRGKEQAGRKLFEVTTDIDRATQVFMSKIERPGVEALAERKNFARRALSSFHGAGAAAGGGGAAAGAAISAGPVVQKLRALIASGAIMFDKASLKDELLGLNTTGVKVTPKLQTFVVKLTEFAAPQKICISSLSAPTREPGAFMPPGGRSTSATRKSLPCSCRKSQRTNRSGTLASTS